MIFLFQFSTLVKKKIWSNIYILFQLITMIFSHSIALHKKKKIVGLNVFVILWINFYFALIIFISVLLILVFILFYLSFCHKKNIFCIFIHLFFSI